MRLATYQSGKVGILYDATSLCDAGLTPQIGASLLDPEYWRDSGHVVGQAPGRGQSLFLDLGEQQWVLRPYRRGGMVARLSRSHYLWTGIERTRAFREVELTAALFDAGLPVPRPILGGVIRQGATYQAALITQRLPQTRALAEALASHEVDAELLADVGRVIRRCHDQGLDHVDLNARNLLIDTTRQVWLIDLDRCRLRRPGRWQDANLARLGRSLERFCATSTAAAQALAEIQRGYRSEEGSGSH
ncbi:3-deoxy-D-manno-octulosonic acid kinase [Halomonas sp. DP3Y7-2]|nr:3-deoxy-D-manno-octulosonic acid kinase [Halomonas sp. DP3Y7-2]MBY6227760.1 3-deoxy-D-manno-octulosonic acid kinase [Halomonas sp. DP3Y7-1]MCA0915827.1 3-deoxy-D-manno-octulosonic acid kinase [Halomonas denitrificans]